MDGGNIFLLLHPAWEQGERGSRIAFEIRVVIKWKQKSLSALKKNQKRFAETKKIPTFAVPTKRERLNGCSEAENKD